MLIPISLIKYIAIFNAVFWPLHYLGVRDGIAESVAAVACVAAFVIFRRARRRRWYERLAMEQLARESADAAPLPPK